MFDNFFRVSYVLIPLFPFYLIHPGVCTNSQIHNLTNQLTRTGDHLLDCVVGPFTSNVLNFLFSRIENIPLKESSLQLGNFNLYFLLNVLLNAFMFSSCGHLWLYVIRFSNNPSFYCVSSCSAANCAPQIRYHFSCTQFYFLFFTLYFYVFIYKICFF